jgi:hypothetical protein
MLEAVDFSSRKYLRYNDEGEVFQDSAEEFISKIGGILLNNKRTPIEQKASYIKGICRNRFSRWNPQSGSITLNNYINELRKHGWTDGRILDDLENEVMPKTKQSNSIGAWRHVLEESTDQIDNWDNSDEDESYTPSRDDLEETVNQLVVDSVHILPALEHLGEPFERFSNEGLGMIVNAIVVNYLDTLKEHNEIPLKSEGAHRIIQMIQQSCTPCIRQ